MKLMQLVAALAGARVDPSAGDPEIARVSHDSRSVLPGDLFIAIRGAKANGLAHTAEAIALGASAVLSDRAAPEGVALPWVTFENPRLALGLLAAHLAGDPSEKLVLVGVTGTNGKTTTATLLEALLERRHGRAGFLGTVGYRTGTSSKPAERTTPDATLLQALLAELVAEGVPAAAMEVSSHALTLERAAGCRFDLTVFTNLTRDHLDFHRDFESYYEAKKKLFSLRKKGAWALLNADDPAGGRFAEEIAAPVATYSALGAPADFRAEAITCDLSGTAFDLLKESSRWRLTSPLLGRFNVENLLAAASGAFLLGMDPPAIAAAIASVWNVPGRMERVEAGQPYTILVDYAHTEDALRRLLSTVRDLTDKKIVLVFGCGGERDTGKRFPMGEVAGRLADIPIATSDNPRSEDPDAILSQIEEGIVSSGATKYLKLPDRREAIRAAIELANPGTVVVIAGKGHETTQTIGGREIPFDDRLVAAELARRIGR